jgi:glycine/D-amino acid oxidase-like deaminating enzyme
MTKKEQTESGKNGRIFSRRSFIGGAAAGAALGIAGSYATTTGARRAFQSPAKDFFGFRSNCYWIESTGMEDSPLLGPLRGDIKADVVIIGGGYTGLASALYLTEKFPEKKVVILEGARVGYGASGRNDGVLLPLVNGSEEIIDQLIDEGRIEEAREIFEKTSAGIGLIDDLVKNHNIDCEWEPRSCLIGALTESQAELLEKVHERYAALGLDSEWLSATEQQRRVNVQGYRAAFTAPVGGMINPAKLARGLLAKLLAKGVSVYEGSRAVEITPGSKVKALTPAGSVTAPALVLATNAYTSKLGFFQNRVLPIHSFSIATEPLSEKQIETLNWGGREPFLDVRNFFEVFRLTADNRVVFSGGEAYYYYQDGLGEDENHPDYARLERALFRKFPMLEGINVENKWVGHVGLTLDMKPTVGVTGPEKNIYHALGYSGHGVTVSFLAGKLISELYSGERIDPAYDFIVNQRPPAVPPEPFKSTGFALYKRYLHWYDSR